MKVHAPKKKEAKVRAPGKAVFRKPGANRSSLGLVDHRSGVVAHGQRPPAANGDPRAARLRAFRGAADNDSSRELTVQKKEEITGWTGNLTSSVGNPFGDSREDMGGHDSSYKPTRFQADADAQGVDEHSAPGKERHLTDDARHEVQKKEERIQPTGWERGGVGMPIQRKVGFEYEVGAINPKENANWTPFFAPTWRQLSKGYVIKEKQGYDVTADLAANGGNNLEFVTRPFDETKDGEGEAVTGVAQSIVADIQELAEHDPKTDIKSSTLSRIHGPRSVYFDVQDTNPVGQLQMTGGVDVRDLADIMSGEGLGDIPEVVSQEEGYKAQPLQKYYRTGIEGQAMPIVFGPALAAVGHNFELEVAPRRMIASVVALMAQMIITHREEQEDTNLDRAGRFIAKTDFAEILQQVDDHIEAVVDWSGLLPSILAVANGFVEDAVNGNSPVFPATYNVQGKKFTDLSIKDWVTAALPQGRKKETRLEMIDDINGMPIFIDVPTGRLIPKGKDKMTKASYPGTSEQKEELGAYGTYGSKKDPGGKVILEWRDLRSLFYASQLPKFMSALFGYYRGIRG